MRFLLILIFLSFNCTLQARTITVGAGKTFTSLKKAIEHAIDRDTILLFPGTYKEGSLTITKQIALLGQNNPVLDGENKYEILLVSGNNITVKGIQFKNSGYSSMNDFASVKLVD